MITLHFSSYQPYLIKLMYSLTQTGIHLLHPPQQSEPQVKIQCKCNRHILQEQIYTCINCSTYCCHYCTVPQFTSQQCRSCKRMYQSTLKNSRCTFCFACPYCQNVLTLSRDPKSKLWIYFCQFCYWNTKEINMKEERPEILQDNLFKLTSLRDGESRIYNTALTLFKETNISIQMENQSFKYTHNKRPSIRSSMEESNLRDRQQLKKINEGIDNLIKHTSLDEQSQQFVGIIEKYPQALPLISKKTRRCPQCSKPLTNIYRPVVSNQPNIELMHKDLKIIQSQRLAPVNGVVRIKFLKNCVFNQKPYKVNQQEDVEVNKPLKIIATIQNKRKNVDVAYIIFIEPYEKKK